MSLYNHIELLPFDGQGWFHNAVALGALIDEIQPKVVIEVGSWLGQSTRWIANQCLVYHSNLRDVRVLAVDTWRGSPQESVHMQDPRLPTLFQRFLSNTIHAGLQDVIVPIRMESTEASQALKVEADLIYIDAAHDEDSVYDDIMNWFCKLKPGGVMCGDDITWPSVERAVRRAAADTGLNDFQVYRQSPMFWTIRGNPRYLCYRRNPSSQVQASPSSSGLRDNPSSSASSEPSNVPATTV